MFESLDVSTPVRVLVAVVILAVLLGAFFWIVRWFGAERIVHAITELPPLLTR